MRIFEIEVFQVFLLVMTRFSGLIVSAPVLGSRNVPIRAKAGLAALSAMVVTPVLLANQVESLPPGQLNFGVMAIGELAIGLIIGFVMTIVFGAIQVAGQLMDMQSGFGMVNVFNPALETQVPVFGFFFFLLAVLFLLVIDGHVLMFRALASTFERIPLGGIAIRPGLLLEVSVWAKLMFYDGLMIAAPVSASMLLAYVAMGLMGRVVPQIHLFVVGFPVTISLALFVVAASAGMYLLVLDGIFARMFRTVQGVITGLG